MSKQDRRWKVSTHILIFIVALLPRVMGLDAFMSPDEGHWVRRSMLFLRALLEGNPSGTILETGHPGITTVWAGTAGLVFKYLVGALVTRTSPSRAALQQLLNPVPLYWQVGVDDLVATRVPMALLTALGVVGIYVLTRKLFGSQVAFAGAFLVAFDPFYLAHSRMILSDVLLATFMSLSVYSFMVYFWSRPSLTYLIISGVMAGLAFLTKSPALFLVPYIASMTIVTNLTGDGSSGRAVSIRHIMGVLMVWGIIAGLTFVALWPAMWSSPVEVILKITREVERHEPFHPALLFSFWPKSNYLLGRLPRFLSYPLILLFRITPAMLVGVAAAAFFLGEDCYRHLRSISARGIKLRQTLKGWASYMIEERETTQRVILLWLGAYVLLFVVSMSFSTNTPVRYILPVFPSLALIAVVGLCQLVERAAKAVQWLPWKLAAKGMVGLAMVLIFQAGFSLPHHPYYFTYYNPLVGGSWTAPQVLLVGEGEGFDRAARYLNGKKNAVNLKASARPPAGFAPFFVGQTVPFHWGKTYNVMPWYAADYSIFYIYQWQKGRPNAATARYFRSLEPEHTVRLKGIDYAWVYKTPKEIPDSVIPAQHIQQAQFGDCMLLRGYDIDANQVAHDGKLGINLYWQCSCPISENYGVFLKLLNGARHIWGQQESRPLSDGLPTSRWEEAVVVRDGREIEVLPGTLPGPYLIEVILYDFTSEKWVSPQGKDALILGPVEIPRREIPTIESLDIEHPLKGNLGGKIQLLGYNLESGFRPGDGIHLTLFWQCLEKMNQDYTVFTHLIDEENKIWTQKDNQPVDGFYATTRWEAGEIVRDQYDLLIPSDAPAGEYQIEAGMYLAETGERMAVLDEIRQVQDNRVVLEQIRVVGR
jgi:hypothetical protein